eukprot:PhF_6_TR29175/c1_g1_i2/m.42666
MPFSEFAGGDNFRFFNIVAPYVDRKKAPGDSTLPIPTMKAFFTDAVLLRHIWASPNLVWLVMSILLYVIFPYDLKPNSIAVKQGPISKDFFWQRFPLWFSVVMGYFLFWHVTLYVLGWGKRPFIANRPYRIGKVAHNVFYCVTGIAIWVMFENVFCHLWGTGKLPYMSDAEAIGSLGGFVRMSLGLALVPLWRDFHFYFAHRLIHFRPMFTQIHSLHHRNTDVEPFAGMCMHPMEHLYYFASVMPSVLLYASPLHCVWNAMHFLVAPAAGHSGYEDHFQSDVFHYYHHRYFEVNYAGMAAGYLDKWFGSFHATGWRDKDADGTIKIRDDTKADANLLKKPPTVEFVMYMVMGCGCVVFWIQCAGNQKFFETYALSNPWIPSAIAGFGPAFLTVAFQLASDVIGKGKSGSEVFVNLIKPFEKRPLWETLLHVFVGTVFCSYTITALAVKVF